MANQQHPITPPPELRCQWQSKSPFRVISVEREDYMIDRAAQWGADTELEACCKWLDERAVLNGSTALRTSRRPKPPSLKVQALKMLRPLSNPVMPGTPEYRLYEPQAEIIRRALEALPND